MKTSKIFNAVILSTLLLSGCQSATDVVESVNTDSVTVSETNATKEPVVNTETYISENEEIVTVFDVNTANILPPDAKLEDISEDVWYTLGNLSDGVTVHGSVHNDVQTVCLTDNNGTQAAFENKWYYCTDNLGTIKIADCFTTDINTDGLNDVALVNTVSSGLFGIHQEDITVFALENGMYTANTLTSDVFDTIIGESITLETDFDNRVININACNEQLTFDVAEIYDEGSVFCATMSSMNCYYIYSEDEIKVLVGVNTAPMGGVYSFYLCMTVNYNQGSFEFTAPEIVTEKEFTALTGIDQNTDSLGDIPEDTKSTITLRGKTSYKKSIPQMKKIKKNFEDFSEE